MKAKYKFLVVSLALSLNLFSDEKDEGAELLYQKLLECDMDVKKVKSNNTYKLDNTLYIHENNIWEGPVKRIQNLMSVPSPYNLGLMDKFFKQDGL